MKDLLMAGKEYYIFLNVLLCFTVVVQMAGFISMKKLLKAARNVKETENHNLIKQMKLGYTNAYKLSYGVNNTKVFIEKYLMKNKVLGLPMRFIATIDEKMCLCVAIGTIGALLLSVYREQSMLQLIFVTGVGIMYVLALRLVGSVLSAYEMKNEFMVCMTDYFENVLQNRLKNHKRDSGKIISVGGVRPKEPKLHENSDIKEVKPVKETKEKVAANRQTAAAQTPEEQIVEDIIKEFFPE